MVAPPRRTDRHRAEHSGLSNRVIATFDMSATLEPGAGIVTPVVVSTRRTHRAGWLRSDAGPSRGDGVVCRTFSASRVRMEVRAQRQGSRATLRFANVSLRDGVAEPNAATIA
jgi:hypothetical protein